MRQLITILFIAVILWGNQAKAEGCTPEDENVEDRYMLTSFEDCQRQFNEMSFGEKRIITNLIESYEKYFQVPGLRALLESIIFDRKNSYFNVVANRMETVEVDRLTFNSYGCHSDSVSTTRSSWAISKIAELIEAFADDYNEFVEDIYDALRSDCSEDFLAQAEQAAAYLWPTNSFCLDILKKAYEKAHFNKRPSTSEYGKRDHCSSKDLTNARRIAEILSVDPILFEENLVEKIYDDTFRFIRSYWHMPTYNLHTGNPEWQAKGFKQIARVTDFAIEIAQDNNLTQLEHDLEILKNAWQFIKESPRDSWEDWLNTRFALSKLEELTEQTRATLEGPEYNDPEKYDRVVLDFMHIRDKIVDNITPEASCPVIPRFWIPTNERCEEIYQLINTINGWDVYSYTVKDGENPTTIARNFNHRQCFPHKKAGWGNISSSSNRNQHINTIKEGDVVYIFVKKYICEKSSF